MILDSSALMAILQKEDGSEALIEAAVKVPCRLSAATWVEVGVVADSRGTGAGRRLDDLLQVLEVTIEDVTPAQAAVARAAYRRFGQGSGSPARLNFGDCLAYALAVTTGEPLLFVGDDFRHTDIAAAV